MSICLLACTDMVAAFCWCTKIMHGLARKFSSFCHRLVLAAHLLVWGPRTTSPTSVFLGKKIYNLKTSFWARCPGLIRKTKSIMWQELFSESAWQQISSQQCCELMRNSGLLLLHLQVTGKLSETLLTPDITQSFSFLYLNQYGEGLFRVHIAVETVNLQGWREVL